MTSSLRSTGSGARPYRVAGLPFLLLPLLVLVPASPVAGQNGTSPNRANWELLARFNGESLDRFIGSTSVEPNWIHETDSLWYRWEDRAGTRYHLVVPAGPQKRPLFDHEHMAARLSAELQSYLEPHALPIEEIEFSADGRSFTFVARDVRFEYHLGDGRLVNLGPAPESTDEDEEGGDDDDDEEEDDDWRNFSPDSTAYVYAEEHNLFFVDMQGGTERAPVQLTTDGEDEYSFGSIDEDADREDLGPAGLRVRADVTWSEDGRAFAVTRNDRRHVQSLYLVDVLAEPRPTLEEYKYSMPGEDAVPQVELHVFDRGRVALRPVDVSRFKDQRLFDIHWTNGGSDRLRMVRRARSQRYLELIEVDLAAGGTRVLLTEGVDRGHLRLQDIRYLGEDNSGDFIWYSRRSGWAHIYRVDHDGNIRNAITSGPWNVQSVEAHDGESGVVWFQAVGREPGENVNLQHLYRANVDGAGLALLDEGNLNHESSVSPSRRYVLDNASRVDAAPRSVLRDNRGRVVLELEAMDLSELIALGWRMPETFVVTGADGITDIYGNMWKPFDFDPSRRYPVIANVYPGPQQEAVSHSFSATNFQQELAQLGFIVIQIGNRGGTPFRSAAYHSYGYFNLRDYALADKKAGIEELAKRYPWIDATRVGIFGGSGGGFLTGAALLVEPFNEFFTVGVSARGNHDNNVYNQNWSEQHHGLEVRCVPPGTVLDDDAGNGANGSASARQQGRLVANESHCGPNEDVAFEIDVPANHELAANLKGHLLLVHGDMDNNVHHAGTMKLVRELIKNEKRFDFMIMPGMRHSEGADQDYAAYLGRMRQEYFARHLLGDSYDNADLNVR